MAKHHVGCPECKVDKSLWASFEEDFFFVRHTEGGSKNAIATQELVNGKKKSNAQTRCSRRLEVEPTRLQ